MLKRTLASIGFLALTLAFCALAQEATAPADLIVEAVVVTEQQDIYGQTVQVAQGRLVNESVTAYSSISLNAEVYDEEGALIGEGIGFLVDACDAGLLPDFVLHPNHAESFTAPLELYEQNAVVDRVEIIPQASPAETDDRIEAVLADGITQVTDEEVVEVEWNGPRNLRYAVGCVRDLFSEWDWHNYSTLTDNGLPAEHPFEAEVNDELRERLGLDDPLIFANSFIRYSPSGDRLIFQDDVNSIYSAADDGTLQRLLYSSLNNRTLQDIYWLDDDRFLAYYYGAFGDPVIYFTADAEGRYVSPAPLNNPESIIVPGPSRDARRVVIAGTFDDVTGYYLNVLTNDFFELLFEAEPPGNNYPGPIPIVDTEEDRVVRVYVARPVNGEAMMQCFNRDEGVLRDLVSLPLNLTEGERAQWWLSPNEQTIALAANGVNSGLWLIDLRALPSCEN
jgi:hypothetical protein